MFRILGNIDDEMRGRRRLEVGGTKQVKKKIQIGVGEALR